MTPYLLVLLTAVSTTIIPFQDEPACLRAGQAIRAAAVVVTTFQCVPVGTGDRR